MTLTVGSLFAGVGGFDLGFERAGMVPAWQVEIDAKCRAVLARHWPDAKRLHDVREVGAHNLSPVDVIAFGSPCQDLSKAGKRAGLKGKRSGLFFEAIRIMGELHPTFAVWENVPGALSSNDGRDFRAILAAFQKCGARDIAWRTLDAQGFGVAQRRRRVFLVADFGGERAAEILFEREGLPGDSAAREEARAEPAGTLAPSAHPGGFNGRDAEEGNVVVANALSANPANRLGAEDTYVTQALTWRDGASPDDNSAQGRKIIVAVSRDATPKPGNHVADLRASNPHPSIIAFDYALGGGDRTQIYRSGDYAQLQASRPDAIAFTERSREEGRTLETQDELAYALTNPGSGGRTHSRQIVDRRGVRRLMPVECERLQGFPDGWTEYGIDEKGERVAMSDSARYRQLGNAVCVPVAEWIARRLVVVT